MRSSSALLCMALLIGLPSAGCTKIVEKGTYGPFEIGESKIEALKQTKGLGVHLEPVVAEDIHIKNPNMNDLIRLNSSDGILVWLGGQPWPLRIEFTNDRVSALWPKFDNDAYSPKSKQELDRELARLSSIIKVGSTRIDTYKTLLDFRTSYSLEVGNFIVGYQKFIEAHRFEGSDYDAMLMQNSAWQFTGLRDLVWFNPYYSEVTLYFDGNKLKKIRHWRFPFEVP